MSDAELARRLGVKENVVQALLASEAAHASRANSSGRLAELGVQLEVTVRTAA